MVGILVLVGILDTTGMRLVLGIPVPGAAPPDGGGFPPEVAERRWWCLGDVSAPPVPPAGLGWGDKPFWGLLDTGVELLAWESPEALPVVDAGVELPALAETGVTLLGVELLALVETGVVLLGVDLADTGVELLVPLAETGVVLLPFPADTGVVLLAAVVFLLTGVTVLAWVVVARVREVDLFLGSRDGLVSLAALVLLGARPPAELEAWWPFSEPWWW